MQNQYDVTIITVRPATHLKAFSVIEHGLATETALLSCWFSTISALNQIMILGVSAIRGRPENRMATQKSKNPFDVGEFMSGMTMDTFVAFDFLPPMQLARWAPVSKCAAIFSNTAGWR